MDDDRNSGNDPRRIEVDPSDVRVVMAQSYARGAPPPSGGTPLPFLRRHRVKLGLGLAIIELIVLGFGPGDYLRQWIGLLAIAVAAIFVQIALSRYLPYILRQVTWAVAFAQALVALFPIFFGVGIVIIVILLLFAVLAGLALLLGDRR